jgi:hypothetical protein
MYGFPSDMVDSYIESETTNDGVTWTKDSGRRLEVNPASGLESIMVKDPGILITGSGTYMMFYVTRIP